MSGIKQSRTGHYLLVGLVSAAVSLWYLGVQPMEEHECFVAVTARAMADPDSWLDAQAAGTPVPANTTLNHWLVPVFNGTPRLVKTPLAYWCVTALVKLGLTLDEFTARLPSALSAIGLALVTLALGRRLFPPRAALLGALMLATTLGFQTWGRNARPELLLTVWMTVAMACFYAGIEAPTARRRHGWLLLGFLAAGVANLAKQFVPVLAAYPVLLYLGWRASERHDQDTQGARVRLAMCLGGTVIGLCLYWLLELGAGVGRWPILGPGDTVGRALACAALLGGPLLVHLVRSRAGGEIRRLLPSAVPGVLLMLLLFVPWLVYMASLFPQTGGTLWSQVAERAAGTGKWSDNQRPGFYLFAIASLVSPWVGFLPGGVAIPWLSRFREHRGALLFLFCWLMGLVLLFSATDGQRIYYILPALPPACLLAGYCADDVFFRRRLLSRRLSDRVVVGYLVAAAAVPAGVWLCPVIAHSQASLQTRVLLFVGLMAPIVAAVVCLRREHRQAVAALLLATVALGYLAYTPFADRRPEHAGRARVGRQAADIVPPGVRVGAVDKADGDIVYYFGRDVTAKPRPLTRFGRPDRLATTGLWLFGSSRDAHWLSLLGFEPRIRENRPKRSRHRLVLYHRAPSTHVAGADAAPHSL